MIWIGDSGMITKIEWIECKCDICGHTWKPRSPEVPRKCAWCLSPDWNLGQTPEQNEEQPTTNDEGKRGPFPGERERNQFRLVPFRPGIRMERCTRKE